VVLGRVFAAGKRRVAASERKVRTIASMTEGRTVSRSPGRPGRHRAPRRRLLGAHLLRPARHRARRPARYAAAGLLAFTGAVAPALLRAETRPAGRHVPRPATRAAHAPGRPSERAVPPGSRAGLTAVRAAPVRASRSGRAYGPVLRGRATWYGPGFAGRRTASGEVFDPAHDLTAAHRTLPFGTMLRVCRGSRCVVVRVNDRGPYGPALLDLSWLAAERLGMVSTGIADVTATVLAPV
jgi:rare lipoprotein A